MIQNIFSQFKNDESGAVTVDWVVLTAAIVGIAIAVIVLVSGGIENASAGINSELEVAGGFGDWFDGSVYGAESDFSPWGHMYPDSINQGNLLSDAALEAAYLTAYNDALENPNPMSIDTLAGFEVAMVDRGAEIPNGNLAAAELQVDTGFELPT